VQLPLFLTVLHTLQWDFAIIENVAGLLSGGCRGLEGPGCVGGLASTRHYSLKTGWKLPRPQRWFLNRHHPSAGVLFTHQPPGLPLLPGPAFLPAHLPACACPCLPAPVPAGLPICLPLVPARLPACLPLHVRPAAGDVMHRIMQSLVSMGYQCSFRVLNAGSYGIPQVGRGCGEQVPLLAPVVELTGGAMRCALWNQLQGPCGVLLCAACCHFQVSTCLPMHPPVYQAPGQTPTTPPCSTAAVSSSLLPSTVCRCPSIPCPPLCSRGQADIQQGATAA